MEEQEQQTPKPRGGHRDGAGRKPKDGVGSQSVSFRINREHLAIIRDNYPSFTEFVDRAIREKLKRENRL